MLTCNELFIIFKQNDECRHSLSASVSSPCGSPLVPAIEPHLVSPPLALHFPVDLCAAIGIIGKFANRIENLPMELPFLQRKGYTPCMTTKALPIPDHLHPAKAGTSPSPELITHEPTSTQNARISHPAVPPG